MTDPDELTDKPPEGCTAAESDDARSVRRRAAIDALSGSLTGVYGQSDYLADLHADWPP